MKWTEECSVAVVVTLLASVANAPVFAQCMQLQKLTADDAGESSSFGWATSVSGSTAVVGAFTDGCAAGSFCGSAYVLRFNGTRWMQQQKLAASDAAPNAEFGFAVAVEGNTVVIGARSVDDSAGAVYVFRFNGTGWVEEQKLTASDRVRVARFGTSVAVDGGRVMVGAPTGLCLVEPFPANARCGTVYEFRFNGSSWFETQRLIASDGVHGDEFGHAVSLDEHTAVVGSKSDGCAAGSFCGSAYVYRLNGNNWVQQQKLTASDAADRAVFGVSVSVSGDTALIGAFGGDCATGGEKCGSAYVFRLNGVSWLQEQKLTASDGAANDSFGQAVSLFGDTALVGAPGDDCVVGTSVSSCGSAYIYRFDGMGWNGEQKLGAVDSPFFRLFGTSVSLSGETAWVGAPQDNCAGGTACGSAYVFRCPEGPCPTAKGDSRCTAGGAGVISGSEVFPPCGIDDFATGASFKVVMLDGSEAGVGVWVDSGGVAHGSPAVDANTIVGRSDPFFDGDPEDAGALICGGGQPPYPDTSVTATDPCVFPAGFPEDPAGGHEIHTEILTLNLVDPDGNTVKAGQPFHDAVAGMPQERFFQNSFGEVQGLGNDFPADSFFNVFVEVSVPALGLKLYNKTPMVLRAEITSFPPNLSLPRSVYLHDPSFGATPLFDQDGLHVAYLLSSGHGAVDLEPPPQACEVNTVLSSPVSFSVDRDGTGSFPTLTPNDIDDDEGLDVQQVTVYASAGQVLGAAPDITNVRVDALIGDLLAPASLAFVPGDAINSLSYGRDGSRDANGGETFGTLLFSVDRNSSGQACTNLRGGSASSVREQAADIYSGGSASFGAYSGPFLPVAGVSSNTLLADQTVLGLRPTIQATGQDNLTGLEVSAFALGDRFYGTFVGSSFDCGNDDCNANGVPDGCEPDCQPNGVADPCDVDPGDPDGNGLVSEDLNLDGIPDECEPCGPSCTEPPRSLREATVFVYDDHGDPGANPFRLGNLQVFSQAVDAGLQAGDVIDALVLSDLTPGGGVPTPNGVMDPSLDEMLFSLSRSSPSLFGPDGAPGVVGLDDDGENGVDDFGETGLGDDRSPADVFYSNFSGPVGAFITFTSAGALGLLPNDELDALDIGPTLTVDDCNCDDIDDECDIARDFSNDCNSNAIPDECERFDNDCNCNDAPDECDLNAGTSLDCNGSGVPDECEADCDGDVVPDACEIADCMPNDPACRDCNGNDVPDDCDIADGTSQDDNGNGIPDECYGAEGIPAVSAWGVALLALLVLTAGTLVRGRKRITVLPPR